MDPEMLQLSGLQHFSFCPRQWALIHIEQQWQENERTTDGHNFHNHAHNGMQHELRGDTLIMRGLRISSEQLCISGICDVVEFHRHADGIRLAAYDGLWQPYPVEYKNGEPKENNADRLQLCAQAMCLEEMLLCSIPEGSLFYGAIKRREKVCLSESLREEVRSMLSQMKKYYAAGYTPKAKQTKACNACSLKEVCLPRIPKLPAVSSYIQAQMGVDA